jgi:outer membrane PBP1 activator LpoA protein
MKSTFLFLALFLITSCSGVSVLKPDRKVADNLDTSSLYKQEFLQKINLIKDKIKLGKVDIALKDISSLDEKNLNASELSTKRNLTGVIYFQQKKFDLAIKQFELALSTAKDDPLLEAQVLLNLGSSYYKTNQNEKAYSTLSKCNFKNLQDTEAKKYHLLFALLSQQLGKQEQSIGSLIRSLSDKRRISELTSDSKYLEAETIFSNITDSEKVRLLEDFDNDNNLAVAYLFFKEAEKAYKADNKSKMEDYSEWILKRYSNFPEIVSLVGSLGSRSSNDQKKVDFKLIGIILPLSGDSKGLGERALSGIEIALNSIAKTDATESGFKLEMKDSKGSAANGAFAVKELVEQSNVSVIIGGLNSSEATKEYLEAKKHGALFISLSKVLLPKEEKNHLLIEIPGSIESQLSHLFKEETLSKLGNRPALLYPKTEIGEAYANEFWRMSKKLNLDVTGLISFDPAQTDFRDPVKNILGIKFEREREDELAIVNDIVTLESKKNIKRLQNLQPQIDFDWIFVPALPRETVQILPNFNFFDAFNLKYVGVPSWRSELMLNEGYRYGNVLFIDEKANETENEFTKKYLEKFNKHPNFVETISYDSLKVYLNFINDHSDLSTRQDLDLALAKKELLSTDNSSWRLVDDVWIKDMSSFRIKREGFEPLVEL